VTRGGTVTPANIPTPFDAGATTILVSSGGAATAHDTAVIRFENVGASAVTIGAGINASTGATTFRLWDGSLPLVLQPGQNLVLAETDNALQNFDISELAAGAANAVVAGTISGVAFSFTDSGRILFGDEDIGGAPETRLRGYWARCR
jgi:hypothetical protein